MQYNSFTNIVLSLESRAILVNTAVRFALRKKTSAGICGRSVGGWSIFNYAGQKRRRKVSKRRAHLVTFVGDDPGLLPGRLRWRSTSSWLPLCPLFSPHFFSGSCSSARESSIAPTHPRGPDPSASTYFLNAFPAHFFSLRVHIIYKCRLLFDFAACTKRLSFNKVRSRDEDSSDSTFDALKSDYSFWESI